MEIEVDSDDSEDCQVVMEGADSIRIGQDETIDLQRDDQLSQQQQLLQHHHMANHQMNHQLNQQLPNHQMNYQLNSQPNHQSSINHTDKIIELALKFGNWFYSVLPEINRGSFNVDNFWSDSQARIAFEFGPNRFTTCESGQQQIVNLLKQLIQSNLIFRPNLLPQFDGVRAELEQHGLLKVMISGILYSENQPVGWFDNMFGLIPDSNLEDHIWKIKCLDMVIKLSRPLPSIDHLINSYKEIKN